MSWDNQSQSTTQSRAVEVDEGLRSYMLGIYNYMTSALLLTGVVAYYVSQSEAVYNYLFTGPMAFVTMLAPLAFYFIIIGKMQTMSISSAKIAFWAFAVIMGVSSSYIFQRYAGVDITRSFFITAVTFGSMSLYGYTTKRDLSGWGSFLGMGLWGVFLAWIANMVIFKDGTASLVISSLFVLIFTGFVAYDTQMLKRIYYSVAGNADAMARVTIIGALNLYIDVIGIFKNILFLTSD